MCPHVLRVLTAHNEPCGMCAVMNKNHPVRARALFLTAATHLHWRHRRCIITWSLSWWRPGRAQKIPLGRLEMQRPLNTQTRMPATLFGTAAATVVPPSRQPGGTFIIRVARNKTVAGRWLVWSAVKRPSHRRYEHSRYSRLLINGAGPLCRRAARDDVQARVCVFVRVLCTLYKCKCTWTRWPGWQQRGCHNVCAPSLAGGSCGRLLCRCGWINVQRFGLAMYHQILLPRNTKEKKKNICMLICFILCSWSVGNTRID